MTQSTVQQAITSATNFAKQYLGKYGSIPFNTSHKFKYQLIAVEVRRTKHDNKPAICAFYKSANPPDINIISNPKNIVYPFPLSEDIGMFPYKMDDCEILAWTDPKNISESTGDLGSIVVDFQEKA